MRWRVPGGYVSRSRACAALTGPLSCRPVLTPAPATDTDVADEAASVARDHASGDHGICPACPPVVRNLAATAHNALNAYKVVGTMDARLREKMGELARALKDFQPISDEHFATHSHGCVNCSDGARDFYGRRIT